MKQPSIMTPGTLGYKCRHIRWVCMHVLNDSTQPCCICIWIFNPSNRQCRNDVHWDKRDPGSGAHTPYVW